MARAGARDRLRDAVLDRRETKVFSGKVNDIVWDGESKRIIAVGEGKEK